jgi:hypothetical protein
VGAERFRDAQLLAQLRAGDAYPACHHGLVWPSSGKEPVLGLAPAPVKAQQLQQLRRQHDLAGKLALALADADDHPLAVDIGDLQVQRFLTAKPGAVVQGQQRQNMNTLTQAEVRRNRLKNNTTRLSPPPDQAICNCWHKRKLAGYLPATVFSRLDVTRITREELQ